MLIHQVLFQLALTILEVNKDKLIQCNDDGEAMTILGTYFDRIISRDASHILINTRKPKPSTHTSTDVVSISKLFVMRCAIWYHLHNFKNVKNTHGGVIIFVKLQAEACNFTKFNTPLWVFFTFFKLYKWCQVVQRTIFRHGRNKVLVN